ncbi:MAG: hypothetical protein HY717_19450 [Planctomycetes bacterium]|nr:hypothetical protein [Planctomycetota bacterium]
MNIRRGLRRFFPACFGIVLTSAWTHGDDATNGVFGRGSYVGSDRWFSSLTQSVLTEAAAKRSASRAKGGGLEQVAEEDAEKGYFRIHPRSKDGHTPGTGAGKEGPDIWVQPAPDGCWKPPVLPGLKICPSPESDHEQPISGPGRKLPRADGGYTPPRSDGGYSPPRSDGGYKLPRSEGGYSPPQSDGSYKSPTSDGGYRSPKSDRAYRPPTSDGSWKPPQSDGGYTPPRSDGGYKSPTSDGGYKSPRSDGGYKPPTSDGGYKSPRSDGDFKSPGSDGGYAPPPSDGGSKPSTPGAGGHCHEKDRPGDLPEGDSTYKSPKSDGDFKSPGSVRGGTPPDSDEAEDRLEEEEEDHEDGWNKEEEEDEVPLPEGNSDFHSPSSDGDYKSPATGRAASLRGSTETSPPGTRISRNPGNERRPEKKGSSTGSCEEAVSRGDQCILRKDLMGAIAEYRAAIPLAGKKVKKLGTDARFMLGAALLAQRQICEAVKHLQGVVLERPDSLSHLMCGTALLFRGDLEEAEEQLAKCSPGTMGGTSDLLLGIAADAQGNTKAALKAYRRCLETSGSPEEVRRRCEELSPGGEKQAPAKDNKDERESARAPDRGCQVEPRLAGAWRVYSSRLFYDIGGAGAAGDKVYRQVELSADGRWRFGSSSGKWSVSPAGAEDWKRWKVQPYGPSRKITLQGWNGINASGPIEESEGNLDFFWVIYHAEPPAVAAAGDIHMKFGR